MKSYFRQSLKEDSRKPHFRFCKLFSATFFGPPVGSARSGVYDIDWRMLEKITNLEEFCLITDSVSYVETK